MRRLARLTMPLALAAGTAGCATTGLDPVAATARLDAIETRYRDAQMMARVLEPMLPDSVVAKARALDAMVAAALLAARIATTAAAQRAELARAKEGTAALEQLTATETGL